MTDTELLDWLESQNSRKTYTGFCVFRWSDFGRGWRLHETSRSDGVDSIRKAITVAMMAARQQNNAACAAEWTEHTDND